MSRLLVAREIELWRQIVMIEDEPLSEKPVNGTDHEERIRGVMGMDDVEALSPGDVQAPTEARRGEIDVFGYVPGHRLQNLEKSRQPAACGGGQLLEEGQCRNAVDDDTVDILTPRLTRLA